MYENIKKLSESTKDYFGLKRGVQRLLDIIRDSWKGKLGTISIFTFVAIAIAAPIIAPHDPMSQMFTPLQGPQFETPIFGTDTYGRDLLSRLIYGARMSLLVSIGAVTFAAILGTIIGLVSGYFGGWVDTVLMRFIDAIWAFPWLLIAIFLMAIFGQGYQNVIVALGIAYIDDFGRTVRSEVLAIKEEEFVLASKITGMTNSRIVFGEILPNAIATIIVMFTVLLPRAILAETTLTFLGIGVSPETPTWGLILNEGRGYILQAWWLGIIPGIVIAIAVFGTNLFGDALRDEFDVKEN